MATLLPFCGVLCNAVPVKVGEEQPRRDPFCSKASSRQSRRTALEAAKCHQALLTDSRRSVQRFFFAHASGIRHVLNCCGWLSVQMVQTPGSDLRKLLSLEGPASPSYLTKLWWLLGVGEALATLKARLREAKQRSLLPYWLKACSGLDMGMASFFDISYLGSPLLCISSSSTEIG